jgi:GNAT superfamily N-acetyltransferase
LAGFVNRGLEGAMTIQALTTVPTGVEPAQLAAYARLLSEVFGGGKFSEAAVGWRYRDNPAGQVVGADAWDGERLAAHYVTCPLEARIEGRVVRGLLSLNTATHPDYQGRGLFTTLAEAAYARGAEAGYEFVVGVANANSTPGFLKRLGFQHVARLHAGILGRLPSRLGEASLQYEGNWRQDLLAWRTANPAGGYLTQRRGGVIAVWAKTHLPLVRAGAFIPDAGQALRAGGLPAAFTLFLGLEPRLDLGAHLFAPIPERLRPSPLNLIWRPLSDGVPRALDPRAVAFNFLDFDPY